MRWLWILMLVACSRPPAGQESFAEARKSFHTRLDDAAPAPGAPPAAPPRGIFDLVKYPAPAGPLWAYVSPDPADQKKHPAIVWVHGGYDFAIEDWQFQRGERANDQSAAGFREAGVVLMLPSFRGTNDNPGRSELLYGEVDDLLAAVAYAKKLPYVDRVYLGGHSTGATLALLAAAAGADVSGVLALGPVDWLENYGMTPPFAASDKEEWRMRSPAPWMGDIRVPTLLVEGEHGFAPVVRGLASKNPAVKVTIVPGHDHFGVVGPAVDALGRRLGAGQDPFALQADEIR